MTDEQALSIFELFKPYLKQPAQNLTKNQGIYYTNFGKKTELGIIESIKTIYLNDLDYSPERLTEQAEAIRDGLREDGINV